MGDPAAAPSQPGIRTGQWVRSVSKSKTSNDRLAAYVAMRGDLLALAERIVGNQAVAEEVVQDGWIRWQTSGAQTRTAHRFIRRIVRNLCIDHIRRARVERASLDQPQLLPAAPADGEQAIIHREQVERVGLALAELPERTRIAFQLHRVDGLSFSEIGGRLGVSKVRAYQLVGDALAHVSLRLEE